MKKLLVFDLDGTLLDTITDLAMATNHALTQSGYPVHTHDKYPMFVGNGIDKLLERALPEGHKSAQDVAALRVIFEEYYNVHGSEYTKPYEGITSLLGSLVDRDILLAVASNKYHAATVALVKHYFGSYPWSIVLGQREGVAVKPNPQIVYDIIAHTAVLPSEVLYIGDSGVDMQTAKSAKVESVGVSWGFRSVEELQENGADNIVNHPSEILSLLS